MKHFVKLVRPYIVWAFIIIVVPLLLIVLYSVTTGGNDLVNISFTLRNFKKIGEPIYLEVLKSPWYWVFFRSSYVWWWAMRWLISSARKVRRCRTF